MKSATDWAPRRTAARAISIASALVALAACTPTPDKVVDHFLGLTARPGGPRDVLRRAQMIIRANQLRHSDPEAYKFAARCVMNLAPGESPPPECVEPVNRMLRGGESAQSEPEAPRERCVTTPSMDARCVEPCVQHCFRNSRPNRSDPCFTTCVTERAYSINARIGGCGSSFH